MPESHSLMDGKLHVYRRENSRFWQCATYLNGRNHRQSTKETNIAFAREFAREWYLDRVAEARLRKSGKLPAAPETSVVIPARVAPKRPGEKTFREAAAVFEKEFEAMTLGERNTHYVAGKGRVIRLYLNPFFGELPISEVSAGRIQDYRLHRVTPPDEPQRVRFVSDGQERIGKAKVWKRPSRQTLHNEMVCLRQVLKTANRKGWISALPDMSNPYRASGKAMPRVRSSWRRATPGLPPSAPGSTCVAQGQGHASFSSTAELPFGRRRRVPQNGLLSPVSRSRRQRRNRA